jgi:CheY-like chemotaxis protein
MKTILVADDHPDTNEVLCKLLRRRGYRTISALSGEAALQMLDQERPDLLILDVVMPGIGGMEVLNAVRSNPATKDLPVILFTGVDEADFQANARQQGASDYWVKGAMEVADLEKMIARHIGQD